MTALEFRAVNVPHTIELLRGLTPQEIDLVLAPARPRRFSAKSEITHQGEPAARPFVPSHDASPNF